jgi:hypothetical protein
MVLIKFAFIVFIIIPIDAIDWKKKKKIYVETVKLYLKVIFVNVVLVDTIVTNLWMCYCTWWYWCCLLSTHEMNRKSRFMFQTIGRRRYFYCSMYGREWLWWFSWMCQSLFYKYIYIYIYISIFFCFKLFLRHYSNTISEKKYLFYKNGNNHLKMIAITKEKIEKHCI